MPSSLTNERDVISLCIAKIRGTAHDIRSGKRGVGLRTVYSIFRKAYEDKLMTIPTFVVGAAHDDLVIPDICIKQIIRVSNLIGLTDPMAILEAIFSAADLPMQEAYANENVADLLDRYPLLASAKTAPSKDELTFVVQRLKLYVDGQWSTAVGSWKYATAALQYCLTSRDMCNLEWINLACSLWKPSEYGHQAQEWNIHMKTFFWALADQNSEKDEYEEWLRFARSAAMFIIAYVTDDAVNAMSRHHFSAPKKKELQDLLYHLIDAVHLRDEDQMFRLARVIPTKLFICPLAIPLQEHGGGTPHETPHAFRIDSEKLGRICASLDSGSHSHISDFVHETGGGSLEDYIDYRRHNRNQAHIAGSISSGLKAKYVRQGGKKVSEITFPEFETLWGQFVSNLRAIEEERRSATGTDKHPLTEEQLRKRKSLKTFGAAAANGDNAMPEERFMAPPTLSLAEQLSQQKTQLKPLDREEIQKNLAEKPPPEKSKGLLAEFLRNSSQFISFGQMGTDEESAWSDDEDVPQSKSVTFTEDTGADQDTRTVIFSSSMEVDDPTPATPPPPASAVPPSPPRPASPIPAMPPPRPTSPAPTSRPVTPEPSKEEKGAISQLMSAIIPLSDDEADEEEAAPIPIVPAPEVHLARPTTPQGVAVVHSQEEEVTGRSWERSWKSGTDILDFITTKDDFDVFTYWVKLAASLRYSIKSLRSLGSKNRRPYSRKTKKLQDFNAYYDQNKKKGESVKQFITRNTPLFTADMSVEQTYELMNRLSTAMLNIIREGLRNTNQDWDAAFEKIYPNADLKTRRQMYDFFFFMGELAQAILPSYKRTHGFGYSSPYVFVTPKNTEVGHIDNTKQLHYEWKLANGIHTGATTDHFAQKGSATEKSLVRRVNDTNLTKELQDTMDELEEVMEEVYDLVDKPFASSECASRTIRNYVRQSLIDSGHGDLLKESRPATQGLARSKKLFGKSVDPIRAKMRQDYAVRIHGSPLPSTRIHEDMLTDLLPHVAGCGRYQLLLVRDAQMEELADVLDTEERRKMFLKQHLVDRNHRCLHDHHSGQAVNGEGHILDKDHTIRFANTQNMNHDLPGDKPIVLQLPILY